MIKNKIQTDEKIKQYFNYKIQMVHKKNERMKRHEKLNKYLNNCNKKTDIIKNLLDCVF